MKVLVTGAGGLLGGTLRESLAGAGHTVVALGRLGVTDSPTRPAWNTATGEVDPAALRGAEAVVHLAGENIGAKRWSPAHKARMVESRVGTTRRLCEYLATHAPSMRVFLGGSAMGYYGHRGQEWVDEASARGEGFLPELCEAWEDATRILTDAGVRVVNLRTSVALTPSGAPLSRMLVPFRLGLGGPLGDGTQYLSWIDLEDHVRAMQFLLADERARGPVNLTSPEPVTNLQFTRVLAKVVKRPAFMRVPAFAARAAFGELADELLLASTRVRPKRLTEFGFEFRHPDLEASLRHQLGRP
jgi:uncharacterized protein (TIGR01777 family)